MSLLLSPLQVGSVEVRNRIAFTAHGSFLEFYRPGAPADRYVAYEERRARGGVGLIFLQTMHVHPSSHATGHYPYEPDDLRPKLAAMADALHRHDTRVVQQLNPECVRSAMMSDRGQNRVGFRRRVPRLSHFFSPSNSKSGASTRFYWSNSKEPPSAEQSASMPRPVAWLMHCGMRLMNQDNS